MDNASGWRDEHAGDVVDLHNYVEPAAPSAETSRASVLGEFGGIGLKIEGHTWNSLAYAYESQDNSAALQGRYLSFIPQLQDLMHRSRLSAAVYAQIVDVEGELNGWLTYDRVVTKIDAAALRAAHQNLIADALRITSSER